MSKKTKSTGRKRKAIRRLSIRLTTCDELTLRRLSRIGKTRPSAVVRGLIREAGDQLAAVEALAAASGKAPIEVAKSLASAIRERADEMQPTAPESA